MSLRREMSFILLSVSPVLFYACIGVGSLVHPIPDDDPERLTGGQGIRAGSYRTKWGWFFIVVRCLTR